MTKVLIVKALRPGDLVYQPDTKIVWELVTVPNLVIVTAVPVDADGVKREMAPLSMPYQGLEKLARCQCGRPVRTEPTTGDSPQCDRCLAVEGDNGIETRHEG